AGEPPKWNRTLEAEGSTPFGSTYFPPVGSIACDAITRFAAEYGAKYPKAVTTLEKDADALLTFFDFPAEHWKHLRTSNVIESPFAAVRLASASRRVRGRGPRRS